MSVPTLCNVVDRCGGCPWLASSGNAERDYKLAQLQTVRASLGTSDVSLVFRAAVTRVGYRNRIRLRIDEHGLVCFFNPSKSPGCAVLEPGLREFVDRLREWSQVNRALLAPFAYLEARSPDADGYAGVFLTYRSACAPATSVTECLASDLGPAWVSTDRDPPIAHQRVPHFKHLWHYVPLNGFVQINSTVNQWLVEEVVHDAITSGSHTFADLFGGAGNFALPLVQAGLSGTLVEHNVDSVQAAQMSAQQQGLTGFKGQPGDAIAAVRQRVARGDAVDLVIIDPPRAGIRDGLDAISSLALRGIAYCSCNPQTLERDLRALLRLGWSLQQLTGLDMFPGTRHIETLAWLVPSNPGSRS